MSVLLIRDVGAIAIAKFLCEAKVDDVDEVQAMAGAHNKVGGDAPQARQHAWICT